MSELFKCVITPNVSTYKLRSLPVEIRPGLHWIVDGEGRMPDRVIIPAGTQCIEAFSLDPGGKRVVHETLIAGFGTINGPLPAPRADGTVEIVVETQK